MTLTEMGKLLTVAATLDNRSINEFTVQAWFEVIGHLDFEEAREALYDHYATSTAWLMPAHLNDLVKAQRERAYQERLRREQFEAREQADRLALVRGTEDRSGGPSPWYQQAKETLARMRSAQQGEAS